MPEPLTQDDVRKIAELASLELTEDEIETFTRQLADILAYAEQVQQVDTTGVPPTAYVLGSQPLERADEPQPSLPREAILEAAPDPSPTHGLFRVPRVIG